jgi:threonine/homoserine/homoserine lactone efflux protein
MELTLLGCGLGLAAGLSPGPLLTLLVAVSIERGFHAGLRVAIAPLLTDAPIVALALLILKDLPEAFLGGLTLLGGLFVAYLGFRGLRREDPTLPSEEISSTATRDLWQGAVVNFLNPHPWVFWMSVGAPTLVSGWRQSPFDALGYLAGFYGFIVGSKIAVAWLAAQGRHTLRGPWFPRILKFCALLLLFLGVLLCQRGSVQLWKATHPPAEPLSYLMK